MTIIGIYLAKISILKLKLSIGKFGLPGTDARVYSGISTFPIEKSLYLIKLKIIDF